MSRGIVKTGLIDQRNRATQRRRRIKNVDERSLALGYLKHWLADKCDFSFVESIDLKKYLQETECFDVLPEERIRQLAIHLEYDTYSMPGMSGWLALKRIYEFGLKLAPKCLMLWDSMAVSAIEFTSHIEDPEINDQIFKDGISTVLQAIELEKDNSRFYQLLGQLYYFHGDKESAIQNYKICLKKEDDKKTYSWAWLYMGHCYQDMLNWQKALNCYEKVDCSVFSGNQSWRVDVLKEQKTLCLFMTGQKGIAKQALIKILDRYEKEPKVAFYAMSASLWELAEKLSNDFLKRVELIDKLACENELS